jgi:membrane protease YdiL (CAAX protease family)
VQPREYTSKGNNMSIQRRVFIQKLTWSAAIGAAAPIARSCATPSEPVSFKDSSRPTSRVLFRQAFDDLLLFLLAICLVVGVGVIAHPQGIKRDLVNREDCWRFETMPPTEDALLAWSRTQLDLRNFRVQRGEANHEIVLRYERTRTKGPAHPNWDLLGYRMAYLVSAPSLEMPPGILTPLTFWLVVLLAFVAGGAVALFRLSRGRRAGVPLILPTDRPQQGWLCWLLLALVILVALARANEWLLRILHLEQNVQGSILHFLRLSSGWSMLIAVSFVVFVGPVVEELVFRGCLFGRFQAYGYWVSGAIISALLFSVLHGILFLLPFYFGVGIILAWLCHRTRSLWPSMALHCLNNGVALIAVFSANS